MMHALFGVCRLHPGCLAHHATDYSTGTYSRLGGVRDVLRIP